MANPAGRAVTRHGIHQFIQLIIRQYNALGPGAVPWSIAAGATVPVAPGSGHAAPGVIATALVKRVNTGAAMPGVVTDIAVKRVDAIQAFEALVAVAVAVAGRIGARRARLHQGFNPRHIPTGAIGKLDGVERIARGAILDKVMVDGDYLVRALAGVLHRQGQMIAQTPGLNIARGNAARKTQNIAPIGGGIVVGHVGSAVAAAKQVGVTAAAVSTAPSTTTFTNLFTTVTTIID